MKIHQLLGVLVTGVIVSCQKDNLPIPESADPACFMDHPVSHQARNLKGIVGYRNDVGMYTVAYTVPGTIDGRWIGLVCNLPANYQVIGKEIRFSGEFRTTSRKVSPYFGGDEMYYLYLSTVK